MLFPGFYRLSTRRADDRLFCPNCCVGSNNRKVPGAYIIIDGVPGVACSSCGKYHMATQHNL